MGPSISIEVLGESGSGMDVGDGGRSGPSEASAAEADGEDGDE